jgi:hypothetical protein
MLAEVPARARYVTTVFAAGFALYMALSSQAMVTVECFAIAPLVITSSTEPFW